jgi:hypothetical protein
LYVSRRMSGNLAPALDEPLEVEDETEGVAGPRTPAGGRLGHWLVNPVDPPRVPRAGTRRAEAAREGVVLGIVPRPWIGRGPIAVGRSAVALAGSSLARGAARRAPRATILAKAALVGTAVGAEAAAGVARGHRDAHASAHLAGRLRERI